MVDNNFSRLFSLISFFINNGPFGYENQFDPEYVGETKTLLQVYSDYIKDDSVYLSHRLLSLKDQLFDTDAWGVFIVSPVVLGQIFEILNLVHTNNSNKDSSEWKFIHPKIAAVSRKLFEDGHYANAAEDAFIEINDRVKRLFEMRNSAVDKLPDGVDLMNKAFTDSSPVIELGDCSSETGLNIQKGVQVYVCRGIVSFEKSKSPCKY